MKSAFLVAALAAAIPLSALEKVTGKIDSVTVFTDRALVKRVQPVDSGDKTGILRFTALPQAMISDSVRAGATGATVTGVSLRNVEKIYGEEWEDHPLKKKITKLEAEIRQESDQLGNYRDQLRVIDSMMKLTTAQSDKEARVGQLNVDSWERALSFLEEKRQRYHERIRKTDERLEKLRKEQSKASLEFNAVTQVAKTGGIEVEVSYVKSADTAKVELEYLVNNVSWNGVYDLRGSAEGSEFQLVSHAIIRQSSGENWSNSKVTLSTARPSTSMSPGILAPWRVGATVFDNRPNKGSVAGKMGGGMGSSREEGGEAATDSSDVADTSDTTTVSITLPGREYILSDNSDHRVTLGSSPLKGTLTHVAVPSLSSYVYLKARLKNTSAAPVMGTLNAFLDGSFVGNITLKNPAAVGEEFDVFLGPDQRMQLKRTLKRGDVDSSGIFGGKVEVVNQWEIEVANFTKKPRQITVFDQYPIPADPKISTKYIGASRAETSKDANGILTWKLDTKSGEKIKFDFSYSLTFPKEVWEHFTRGYDDSNMKSANEEQYYDQLSNKPAAAPAPRQYNLERMLQKK